MMNREQVKYFEAQLLEHRTSRFGAFGKRAAREVKPSAAVVAAQKQAAAAQRVIAKHAAKVERKRVAYFKKYELLYAAAKEALLFKNEKQFRAALKRLADFGAKD